ncbi:DivIVA domain-containing protein [Nocardioides kribbensis]|uniref:DivIVA domain-containing protein n=1 Tax=Nocardioides kribbensis TaxID=305517 RepID=UPI0032DB0799
MATPADPPPGTPPPEPASPGSPAEPAELARLVETARFTPVRLRSGYDMGQVDDFLADLVQTLRSGGDPVAPATAARFATVRLREGYETADVDALLDEVVVRSGGTPRVRRDADDPRPAGGPGHGAPAGTGSVVQEQKGLLARLFHR